MFRVWVLFIAEESENVEMDGKHSYAAFTLEDLYMKGNRKDIYLRSGGVIDKK